MAQNESGRKPWVLLEQVEKNSKVDLKPVRINVERAGSATQNIACNVKEDGPERGDGSKPYKLRETQARTGGYGPKKRQRGANCTYDAWSVDSGSSDSTDGYSSSDRSEFSYASSKSSNVLKTNGINTLPRHAKTSRCSKEGSVQGMNTKTKLHKKINIQDVKEDKVTSYEKNVQAKRVQTVRQWNTSKQANVTHRGGCHCGAVKFEVQAPPVLQVIVCNCSICSAKRNPHFIVPASHFKLLTSENMLSTYRFNTMQAQHKFCRICGVQSFYIPRSNPDGVAVTFHCIDSKNVKENYIKGFDGKNWEASAKQVGVRCEKLVSK